VRLTQPRCYHSTRADEEQAGKCWNAAASVISRQHVMSRDIKQHAAMHAVAVAGTCRVLHIEFTVLPVRVLMVAGVAGARRSLTRDGASWRSSLLSLGRACSCDSAYNTADRTQRIDQHKKRQAAKQKHWNCNCTSTHTVNVREHASAVQAHRPTAAARAEAG
jgi:hypothetical protein